ncbi:MAG: metallophosphoesterase family protein [Gammaproteobacteria bacterium]|nr:metallophosphoesterase family protein [Gammaproteobacteria bacterium]
MTTKLGLISDVHAAPTPLQEALSLFEREQVDKIICAGDIAGYFEALEPTIDLLIEYECASIIGNHDQAYVASHADETETKPYCFLSALPETLEYELEGKSIYVVHAHPPASQHGGIKLLDVEGELIPQQLADWQLQLEDASWDVLIVGHTHQVFTQRLGNVLVVNPGSTQFNHTCMILTLPDMTVDTYALEGKQPLKSWNWGKFVHNQ